MKLLRLSKGKSLRTKLYREAERQKGWKAERQIERKTDRQRERQTDKQTNRHSYRETNRWRTDRQMTD